ncbi:D-arabinono-1,4-lactone oxidase [Dactylosporangium matsuzakiense]|uniref:FAD-linked oxidoreductase n=1 Tax=Dactylosporangium matsuzakiense TaxID=53360 RepID=A0A9W6KC83_9ACTN|nr:D-arabinono-1,4-lactone oxidase [Dactylosporangium matsuzakiense]UWZ45203.1 FAD-binding protein [Dactylosporangium matsuzakiense]GLK98837.1 FAD-linked oxidoreductase [Dactylosporangium matsuzakiense]
MTSPWANWAGNQTANPTRVARPANAAELGELVRAAASEGLRVKAVGSGHSFTAAAVTDGVRVELDRMASLVRVDGNLVTVQAGMKLSALNTTLAAAGLAMPNLGDIDAQTISGALSTGTHGTGAKYGCLSTFIEALTLVTADGQELACSATQNPDLFAAARVNIGALGVLSTVTLRCAPAFTLRADERPGTLDDVWSGLDEHIASNDHFEFYWFPYTDRVQLKRNNVVADADRPLPGWRRWLDDDFLSNSVFGAACRLGRALPASVPPISRISASALSARTYTAASHEVFCTPRRVRFVEMEYGLPRAALREAFDGLRRIVDGLPYKIQFPVEVRFTAADDIWLSHGYGRDNAYIAIHQYKGAPYEEYFRRFEELTTPLGGRPHWGKMNFRTAESYAQAYPRFADFTAMRDKLDPNRVFANVYTDRVLG